MKRDWNTFPHPRHQPHRGRTGVPLASGNASVSPATTGAVRVREPIGEKQYQAGMEAGLSKA